MSDKNRFDELWQHNPKARLWLIVGMIATAIIIAALLGGVFDQWVYQLVN